MSQNHDLNQRGGRWFAETSEASTRDDAEVSGWNAERKKWVYEPNRYVGIDRADALFYIAALAVLIVLMMRIG